MNRLLAAAALGVFIAALVAIVIGSATSGGGSSQAATTGTVATTVTTQPTTTVAPPKARPVKLTAVGAYDPEGDQHENDNLAPLAVDGNPATFWKTEHYTHGFFKKGVGLVLDTGGRHALSRVAVSTDGPGSRAQIELGNSPAGPFHAVSADRPLSGTTTFALIHGAAGRYVVIWITALPPAGEAHVTEVRAVSA